MRIKREIQPRSSLEAFADANDLTMVVVERKRDARDRFYAHFEQAERCVGSAFLEGTHGNGQTEAEAIADYARKISGERLVISAYKANRREINVPILIDPPTEPAAAHKEAK